MPKTVSRTVRDIVIADVVSVSVTGALDVPAELSVSAVAKIFDDTTGEEIDRISIEVTPNSGTLTALSNILKTDILSDANAALQARGAADVEILPA